MINLTVYSRENCHLCKEAIQLVEELSREMDLTFKIVDIHCDDALVEKYGLMIPVIEYAGKELAYGRVKKDFLSKRIHEHVRIE
ncbi:glutaredoxin family protein [Metabacillus sp. KIGAM252]|uniref:Glutaredoxin family protein n=1 Tax=Metabacillus flavus TaxID=2823519 RepID=A0ABS5LIH2_9BACI|nr:glutaredoxin family protein [Metabacillus flavus]MBS2970555.1 glutaredoxin family protein [Metabacillus flavus]